MKAIPFGPGLLRILLATMVVASHVTRLEVGRVAVVLFFMLSGYWVTVMYQRKYKADMRSALRFYGARLLRIFPTYLIVLALTLIALAAVGTARSPGVHDIFLFGLARTRETVISPAWSLDIELQFYALVPLLCWAMGRHPARAKVVALLAFAVIVTAITWWLRPHARPGTLASFTVAFAIGAASAFSGATFHGRYAAISFLLFLAAAGLALAIPDIRWMIVKDTNGPVNRDIIALLWGSLFIPFLLWNVRQPSGRLDRNLGDLAYTVYLCQWFFVITPATADFVREGMPRTVVRVLEIYASAFAIYFLVERPIEAMRHRLKRGRRVSAPAEPHFVV